MTASGRLAAAVDTHHDVENGDLTQGAWVPKRPTNLLFTEYGEEVISSE
jgi:hypothetical protein